MYFIYIFVLMLGKSTDTSSSSSFQSVLGSNFTLVISLMVIIPTLLIIGIAVLYYYYYHDMRYENQLGQLRDWVRRDGGGEVFVNTSKPEFRTSVLRDADVAFDEVYGRSSRENSRGSRGSAGGINYTGNQLISSINNMSRATENPLRPSTIATPYMPRGTMTLPSHRIDPTAMKYDTTISAMDDRARAGK